MTKKPTQSTATVWARFRFSVIGSLLSAPLARGELKAAIQSLAERIWTHPVNGRDVQYAATTIEGWYYKARNAQDDPVRALQRAVRKDSGKVEDRGLAAAGPSPRQNAERTEARALLATAGGIEVLSGSEADDATAAGVVAQATAFGAAVRGAEVDFPGALESARATEVGLAVIRSATSGSPTSNSIAAIGSPGTARSMKNTRVATAHMTMTARHTSLLTSYAGSGDQFRQTTHSRK